MRRTFTFDGQQIPAINDTDKWIGAEIRAVENLMDKDLPEFRQSEQIMAVLAISIKRVIPTFKIATIDQLPFGELGRMVSEARLTEPDDTEATSSEPDPTSAQPTGAEGNEGTPADSQPPENLTTSSTTIG